MEFAKTISPESRRLLALSRDLFQAYDEESVLALAKPVISELLQPTVAILRLERNDEAIETPLDPPLEVAGADHPALLDRLRKALISQAAVIADEGSLNLDDFALNDESSDEERYGSLIAIGFPPGNPIGTLSALWTTPLTPEEQGDKRTLLQLLAEIVGAALGNIADKRSMQHDVQVAAEETAEVTRQFSESIRDMDEVGAEKELIASTDVLTGLLNRRGFFERADQALKLARRNKAKCLVIFADLDDLREVNDTLGHDTGDRLLRAAGQVLAASFRESDVVARLGGDEFSGFAVDSSGEAAVLERISESITRFHKTTVTPYRVSFSVGVVECDPQSPQSLADYLAMADHRRHLHKQANRN